MNPKWLTVCPALAALSLNWITQGFAADDYPSKPIRLIAPVQAGSSGDVRIRQIAPLVSERLKQPLVIDNRPGAGGNIGTGLAAKSPPDGYTITFIVSTTVAANPHLYRDAGFDPIRDLVPFIVMVKAGAILVVRPDSPIRTVKDLITQAKANPDKLNYGTSGPGSGQHLMGERLKTMAGIRMTAVPYKGDAAALTDLIGGQIDMAFGYALAAAPLINAGRLRPVAVTSATRLAILPDTPTIAESGVPGYDETAWNGFAVPAGTPEPIIKKLHEAFRSAMLVPEFKHQVEASGSELIASTQEYATQLMKKDFERYGKIVRELGLQLD